MTVNQIHILLRNMKCILHRLAEHNQKDLLTSYYNGVKKYKNTVCCMPIASPGSTKHMHSDPSYERKSPFVTGTSKNRKSTVSGDKNYLEIVLYNESQRVCDKVFTSASTVSTTVASKNSGSETRQVGLLVIVVTGIYIQLFSLRSRKRLQR